MSKLLNIKEKGAEAPKSYFAKSLAPNETLLKGIRSHVSESLPTDFSKSADFNRLSVMSDKGLAKSFQAGTGVSPQDQTDAGALRRESLDNDVKVTTWTTSNFTIFNDIVRQPIQQTVAKYIVYYNHGRVGHSLFQPEIGLGRIDNPNLGQKTVSMKFLSAPAQTSLAAQRADVVEDPITIQELGAYNRLGKTIEWAIFYGNADLTKGEPNSGLEFNGLTTLIDDGNYIDRRGKDFSPAVINQAATLVQTRGFGRPNVAYMPTGVKADFVNSYLEAQRVVIPTAGQEGLQAGFDVARFLSTGGPIQLRGSSVMDIDNILDESKVVADNAPLTPDVKATVVTGQDGKFLADDVKDRGGNVVVPKEVGTALSYKVVAVGDADSAPSDAVTATPANETDGIKLEVTLSPIAKKAPDYIAIYRQSLINEKQGYQLIARVPMKEFDASTGTLTFVDLDAVIPGTADVFIGEMSPEVLNLFEFLPVTKLDTAIVTDATNFALLWWGALRLSFPKRWVWIKNVRYATEDTETRYGN